MCERRLYLVSFIISKIKALCVDYHPTGHELVVGLSSGELLVVDCDTFEKMICKKSKPSLHSGLSSPTLRGIAEVKYCPNAKYLAVGAKDTYVYIHDVIDGYNKLYACEGHSSAVLHLTWSKDGDILQSNAADGEISHWLVSNGESSQISDVFLPRQIEHACLGGQRLVSGLRTHQTLWTLRQCTQQVRKQ